MLGYKLGSFFLIKMGTYNSKQRFDILDEAMVFFILKWWNNETKVSPNKHDATKDYIAPKVDEQHVTHVLLEIQVNKVFFYVNLDL
jgi:hypothetical protein